MYTLNTTPLASSYMAAQQAKEAEQRSRLAELQQKLMQQKLDEEQQRREVQADLTDNPQLLQEAQGYAAQGQPGMMRILQRGAPEDVQAMQEMQQQQATQERNKQIFNLRLQAGRGDKQALGQLAQVAPEDPWLKSTMEREKWASEQGRKNYSPDLIEASNTFGLTPEQGLTNPEVQKYMRMMSLEKARGKGTKVTVSMGPNGPVSPLTEGQRAQVQDKIEAVRDTIFQVDELRKLGPPGRFLGAQSRVKNWALEKAANVAPESLSDEQKKLVSDDRRFSEINYNIFNNMRRIVTGAGASEKELEQLRGTIINPSLSSVSYPAAIDRLEDFSRRAEATYARLLRQGVDVGDPGYGEKFDAEMARSASQYTEKVTGEGQQTSPTERPQTPTPVQTPPISLPSPTLGAAARAVKAGMPPMQVVQKMVEKGMIDPQQAREILSQLEAARRGGQ